MKNNIPELFLITHGDLAYALLEAAEKIIGKQNNVNIYSNKKESLPVLADKIKNKLDSIKTRNVIFFVDLMGGSCWTLANMIRKQYTNIVIVTGVNLPMLLSCFMNLQQLPFVELIKKVINDGNNGIYSLID